MPSPGRTERRLGDPTRIVDMAALQAARKYVTEVGDVDAALEAVRQLRTLQVDNS